MCVNIKDKKIKGNNLWQRTEKEIKVERSKTKVGGLGEANWYDENGEWICGRRTGQAK